MSGKPSVKPRAKATRKSSWYAQNKERAKAHSKRWQEANPERNRLNRKAWKAANMERCRGYALKWLRKKYGVEPTRPCPAVCECCGEASGRVALNLDHCHETGKFRGWLCGGCNAAIGKLGDNEEGLLRAIAYLRRAWT